MTNEPPRGIPLRYTLSASGVNLRSFYVNPMHLAGLMEMEDGGACLVFQTGLQIFVNEPFEQVVEECSTFMEAYASFYMAEWVEDDEDEPDPLDEGDIIKQVQEHLSQSPPTEV